MSKILEVAGLGLIAVMIAAFTGLLRPAVEPGLSAVFWICAAGTLGIIIFRKKRKPPVSSE
ncbi:MAG: hypothetical protein D9C04_01075 [Nitrosopumilus sp. B06]|nr:MAG: hypothetical protein EB828_00955 [Nitrosopumilus sp. D6]RNJ80526.1 MAG: hypothetical protein D9C04_01075 [Nitrosopumilus sp. B06]